MGKRSKRFQPLQRLAKHGEQQAAQKLGEAQQALHVQEQRLHDLIQYRQEYAQQFQSNGQGGMDGRQLRSFQTFLMQLDNAIEQQKLQIAQARQQCDDRRQHWFQQRNHTDRLDTAVGNIARQEQAAEKRREQRDNDEHASRRHMNKSG